MSEKSYVGMGYHLCPVCGVKHDEVVLLDRHLKDTLTKDMFCGWQMCEEHKKLKDDGYIALIEISGKPTSFEDAERTGQVAHVTKDAWGKIFDQPIPPDGICFTDVGVIDSLKPLCTAKE